MLPEGLVRSNCGPDSNGNCATRDLKLLSEQRASKEASKQKEQKVNNKSQTANKSKGASEGSIGIDKRP